MGVIITGIGSYVPPGIMTNFDLEKMVDTTDEWIRTRTGIITRRISSVNQTSIDLPIEAAIHALLMAGRQIADMNAVMLAAPLPPELVPLASDSFAKKIGAPNNLTAIDINAECAGFIFALASACEMVENPRNHGRYQRILLASGDATSKFTDYTDRESCVLFGDAGAAVVLEYSPDQEGIIGWNRRSARDFLDCLSAPLGGTMHFGPNGGTPMLKAIVQITPPMFEEFCQEYGINISDIDMVIPHQLNIRITNPIKKNLIKMGLKPEAFYDDNIARYGNCSCSSVPLALDTCYREGKLKPGDLVILMAWGAGLKIGIIAFRWTLPQYENERGR